MNIRIKSASVTNGGIKTCLFGTNQHGRTELRSLLELLPDYKLEFEAENLNECIDSEKLARSTIGIFATPELFNLHRAGQALPKLFKLWVTESVQEPDLFAAVEFGFSGILITPVLLEDLTDALRMVRKNLLYFAPKLRDVIARDVHGINVLTTQEWHVLVLAAQGLICKESSRILNVSAHTINNHLAHIREKMSVHTTMEAVSMDFFFKRPNSN
jgi:DNA-binding NarL/FixJ family response regulator